MTKLSNGRMNYDDYPLAYEDVPASQIYLGKDVTKYGKVWKKSGGLKLPFQSNYDERFVIINKGWVYYYIDKSSQKPKNKFSLKDFSPSVFEAEEEQASRSHVFKIYPKKKSDRTWYFSTETEEEMMSWMEAFRIEIARYNYKPRNTMNKAQSVPDKPVATSSQTISKEQRSSSCNSNRSKPMTPQFPSQASSVTDTSGFGSDYEPVVEAHTDFSESSDFEEDYEVPESIPQDIVSPVSNKPLPKPPISFSSNRTFPSSSVASPLSPGPTFQSRMPLPSPGQKPMSDIFSSKREMLPVHPTSPRQTPRHNDKRHSQPVMVPVMNFPVSPEMLKKRHSEADFNQLMFPGSAISPATSVSPRLPPKPKSEDRITPPNAPPPRRPAPILSGRPREMPPFSPPMSPPRESKPFPFTPASSSYNKPLPPVPHQEENFPLGPPPVPSSKRPNITSPGWKRAGHLALSKGPVCPELLPSSPPMIPAKPAHPPPKSEQYYSDNYDSPDDTPQYNENLVQEDQGIYDIPEEEERYEQPAFESDIPDETYEVSMSPTMHENRKFSLPSAMEPTFSSGGRTMHAEKPSWMSHNTGSGPRVLTKPPVTSKPQVTTKQPMGNNHSGSQSPNSGVFGMPMLRKTQPIQKELKSPVEKDVVDSPVPSSEKINSSSNTPRMTPPSAENLGKHVKPSPHRQKTDNSNERPSELPWAKQLKATRNCVSPSNAKPPVSAGKPPTPAKPKPLSPSADICPGNKQASKTDYSESPRPSHSTAFKPMPQPSSSKGPPPPTKPKPHTNQQPSKSVDSPTPISSFERRKQMFENQS